MIKESSFAKILRRYDYKIHDGDIVAGTIIYKERTGFLVEIGSDNLGYLPIEEVNINLTNQNNSNLLFLNVTRDFFLLTKNLKNYQYILSIKRLDYIRAWKRIRQIYIEDVVLKLDIQKVNKGGIVTYLEGIQGFIPKSHILLKREKILKQINCRLLDLNENKNQLILSNKSANLILSKNRFKLGQIVYGKVLTHKPYGLFVSISNVKALLHISEIYQKSIGEQKDKIEVGYLIKVKIIYLNIKQGLMSVSTHNLKQDIIHLPQY
uniref:Ribosomal protein S1 n=1 Tax=Polysiphonia sertularioides TaxID=945028 RepID=A0A1Z1MGH6_9FLOR|nr:ribosomal protein S1 [Polysiphonia sertularioides]